MDTEQSNFVSLKLDCLKLECMHSREHDECLVQTRILQSTSKKNFKLEHCKSQAQKKSESNDHNLLRKLNCKLSSHIAPLPRAQSYFALAKKIGKKIEAGLVQNLIKRANTI